MMTTGILMIAVKPFKFPSSTLQWFCSMMIFMMDQSLVGPRLFVEYSEDICDVLTSHHICLLIIRDQQCCDVQIQKRPFYMCRLRLSSTRPYQQTGNRLQLLCLIQLIATLTAGLPVSTESCTGSANSFYHAALDATRSWLVIIKPSIDLSVHPSAKRVHCDKTKAPSEKSPIMTNRKSPVSFSKSLRWTA